MLIFILINLFQLCLKTKYLTKNRKFLTFSLTINNHWFLNFLLLTLNFFLLILNFFLFLNFFLLILNFFR